LSSPNVGFDSVSPGRGPAWAVDSDSKLVQKYGCYLRLVFRNNVKSPSGEGSTAKGTTAAIGVLASDNSIVDSWNGRWANTNAPQSYGDIWVKNRYDIPANETAILDIGFRMEGELQFQGHDNRHVSYPQPPRKRLEPDSYYLQVELRASNMGVKKFWFVLDIPNLLQSNDLNQVKIKPIKRPLICKEGSQT